MNIIKDFVYLILTIQEKLLLKKLHKTIGVKNSSKIKRFWGNSCLISLNSIAEADKQKMEEELILLLKKFDFNPNEILKYVSNQGTQVFVTDNAKKLYTIQENEGFFYPQKGIKALCLNLITSGKFSFKTPEMFILSKGEINKYFFIYNFYNWYAFKHGIYGVTPDTQAMLNKYLLNPKDENMKKLQLEDIYKLKNAISQDKASIEFVFKLCQQYETSKQALNKLKNDGINL
ncbi:MAG: hypothetical protein Q4E83_04325 [bacterium]|nr:hypothetical protein [bacterium]